MAIRPVAMTEPVMASTMTASACGRAVDLTALSMVSEWPGWRPCRRRDQQSSGLSGDVAGDGIDCR
jgi:hypothetical protein